MIYQSSSHEAVLFDIRDLPRIWLMQETGFKHRHVYMGQQEH